MIDKTKKMEYNYKEQFLLSVQREKGQNIHCGYMTFFCFEKSIRRRVVQ